MTRPVLILFALVLTACSTQPPMQSDEERKEWRPARVEPELPRPLEFVEIPKPIPFPGQLKPLPHLSPTAEPSSPSVSVKAANAAARIEPTPSGFINAIQVWPYSPAALYQVYSAPGQTTDLVFQAGEQLIDVSVSDPVRWIVGDTRSGAGEAQQAHLIVKPVRTDLKANLIVTTDRRTYYIELRSAPETWMAAVSWEYPADRLQHLKAVDHERQRVEPVAAGLKLDDLRFGYRISGDQVAWKPVRAFDDGRKVYIQFPDTIAVTELPPLFVIGLQGEAQLVNYRVRSPYYIVDRLFDVAELRLGGEHAQVVRITRQDSPRANRRKARS